MNHLDGLPSLDEALDTLQGSLVLFVFGLGVFCATAAHLYLGLSTWLALTPGLAMMAIAWIMRYVARAIIRERT